jgi:hypothetical protein
MELVHNSYIIMDTPFNVSYFTKHTPTSVTLNFINYIAIVSRKIGYGL